MPPRASSPARSTTSRRTAPARCWATRSRRGRWATVLGQGRAADAPLLLGSVKTNLGHLEAAAGIAGLRQDGAGAAARTRSRPTSHYQTPNPHIPFDNLRLKVVAEHTDWAAGRAGRAAPACPRSASAAPTPTSSSRRHRRPHPRRPRHPNPRPSPPWWCRAGRPSGSRRRPPCSPTGWRAPGAEVAAGRGRPHAQPPPHPPPQVRDGRAPGIGTRRSRDCGRWPTGQSRTRRGRRTAAASRTPGTVFVYSGSGLAVGRAWAANCWPTSRPSPRRVAELEPVFVEQVGFSLRDIVVDGAPVSGDRPGAAGADRSAAGVDRAVALLRGASGRGDRALDGRGRPLRWSPGR